MTNPILTQNEDKDLALGFHASRCYGGAAALVMIERDFIDCDPEFGHYSMSLTAYEAITLASQLLDAVKKGAI